MIVLTFAKGALYGALAMGALFAFIAALAYVAQALERAVMARGWSREGVRLGALMIMVTVLASVYGGLLAVFTARHG